MRPLIHAETSKYMAEKAATRVNFCTFSLVPLSFINQSRWKLVKMCILISLTNHITATFWYDPFFMPKQANIWQQRQWRGSIFADFCLFLSHLLTEVPENWSKCVFWLAQPIILLQLFDKTLFHAKAKICKNWPTVQPSLLRIGQFWHENGVGSKSWIKAKLFIY